MKNKKKESKNANNSEANSSDQAATKSDFIKIQENLGKWINLREKCQAEIQSMMNHHSKLSHISSNALSAAGLVHVKATKSIIELSDTVLKEIEVLRGLSQELLLNSRDLTALAIDITQSSCPVEIDEVKNVLENVQKQQFLEITIIETLILEISQDHAIGQDSSVSFLSCFHYCPYGNIDRVKHLLSISS